MSASLSLTVALPHTLAWQEKALCAQVDTEAFFPEKGGSVREAKRVCRACEVRAECLEYALENDERHGIWGGMSVSERDRAASKGRPAPARPQLVLAAANAGATEAGRRPAPDAAARTERKRDSGTSPPPPPPAGSAAANLGVHLRAKLRALGWTPSDLAEKSGLSAHITGRALNGNGADLAVAEALADLTGGYLATMIGPYSCTTCQGEPPEGYSCLECGTNTPRRLP